MNNEKNIIYCSRCGAEMEARSRYCMKCGNLNESHPDNDKYSKVLKKANKGTNGYQIGSGRKLFGRGPDKSGVNMLSEKNANKKIFIIFNVIVIAVLCLISLLSLLKMEELSFNAFLNTGVMVNFIFVGIFSMFFVSNQILFIKIDEYWWGSLIPFYNFYLLSQAVFGNGLFFIMIFIPVVNIFYLLVLYYKLGASFGKSGFLTAILPIIMIPIIAFGSSAYNGVYYVDDDSKDALEKTYGPYRKFADFSGFLILLGILGFLLTNNNYITFGEKGRNMQIVAGSEITVRKVKKAVESGKVLCKDVNDYNTSIKHNGTYYFYSEDFFYEYGFKSSLIDESMGYVKVVNNNGKYSYFISITAGKLGLPETGEKDISVDVVKENYKVKKPNGIMCRLAK